MNATLESNTREAIEKGQHGRLLACLLVSGYAYYHRDHSLLADETFDEGCRRLLEVWSDFKHPHKHLVREEDLRAGTLYAVPLNSYPTLVRMGAERLMQV